MPQFKTRDKQSVIFFSIKVVILIGILTFIYLKLQENRKDWGQFSEKVQVIMVFPQAWTLLLVMALMPLNWLLESFKWRVLASNVVKLSIPQAFIGVLSGVSLSFITPHGLGDYAARIWHTNSSSRDKLVGPIFLGRLLQLSCTLIFGAWGVYLVLNNKAGLNFSIETYLLGLMSFFVLIYIAVLIFRRLKLVDNKIAQWLGQTIDAISHYSVRQFLMAFLFSLGRYLIFFFQFVLLLNLVKVELPPHILGAGVTWVFLAKSVIPTFNFLSDLGIREVSAIYFFEDYGVGSVDVIFASLILWGINILVPALVGALFVFKMKFGR